MITTLSKESIDIKAENLFLEEVIEIECDLCRQLIDQIKYQPKKENYICCCGSNVHKRLSEQIIKDAKLNGWKDCIYNSEKGFEFIR